jgi:hypothetical protein
VKFLDPQEKLILNLKDEIKRLRFENDRLRSTLLTAPASISSSADPDSGYDGFSTNKDGNQGTLHNEKLLLMQRASSANDYHGGYKKGDKASMIMKKKKAVQGNGGFTGKNKKQSEIFYKYPQLKSMLKKEDNGDHTNKRGKKGSMLPRNSNNRQQVNDDRSISVSMLLDEIHALEQENEQQHDTRSVSSTRSRLQQQVQQQRLEEQVHRKAAGPLIFKDKSSPIPPLRESRLNKYYPAENYVRDMDKKRVEVFSEDCDENTSLKVEETDVPIPQKSQIVVDGEEFVKKNHKGRKGMKKMCLLSMVLIGYDYIFCNMNSSTMEKRKEALSLFNSHHKKEQQNS